MHRQVCPFGGVFVAQKGSSTGNSVPCMDDRDLSYNKDLSEGDKDFS
ncbi:MAG TPA: hypothetical protein QF772_10435 [Nitrospinaceae bacterium]|nr:hypothetical protein [Nitrospinaceae bacterium]